MSNWYKTCSKHTFHVAAIHDNGIFVVYLDNKRYIIRNAKFSDIKYLEKMAKEVKWGDFFELFKKLNVQREDLDEGSLFRTK